MINLMFESRNYPFILFFLWWLFIYFIHKLGYINYYPYFWININTLMMEKTKKCNRCGVKVYPNQKNCSKCVDIILFGSVEKARESAKQNFKKLGL